jgi:CHAT domain-containing protein
MTDVLQQLLNTDDSAARRLLLRESDLPQVYTRLMEAAGLGLRVASQQAVPAAQIAAEAAILLADPRGEAAARRLEGQALRVAGRHAEAVSALDAASAAAGRAGDSLLTAQVRVGQIDSLGWLGRVEEAASLARSLESELLRLGAEADAAKVLVNRGNLAFRRDEYAEALGCYERAGEMLSRSGEETAVARVQASRANILTHLSRVDEALVLYREANETFTATGMAQEAAMGEGNIAFLEYLSGRMTAALSSFQRARQAFDARGQEIEVAKADLDIADIYRVLNLLPEALEHYERAIRVFQARELPYERAKAEMGRGAALAADGRPEDALEALSEADMLFSVQKNRLQRAHVTLIRAEILCQADLDEEARAAAVAAERAFRRARLPGWAAEARYIYARIDLRSGGVSESRAARRMAGVARAARRYARGWLECRAEESIARLHEERGREAAAIRHYRRGVEALEAVRTQVVPEEMHVAFLRDKLSVYDGLITLLLSRGRPRDIRDALEQVERARSRLLLERLEAALSGEPNKPARTEAERALRGRIAHLRAELNRAYHQVHTFDDRAPQRLLDRPGGESAVSLRLMELEEDYVRALREWELARGASERRTSDITGLDELQGALDEDETLVEFYVGAGHISAFLVTRDRTRLCHRLASAEVVGQAARRLRYHLQRIALAPSYAGRHSAALHTGVTDVTACLYEMLWRPLERAIRTEKVTVVPHGLLHGLPFHAFGGLKQAVLDRWEVVYAPSATFRKLRPLGPTATESRRQSCALLIGVPSPGIEQVGSEIGTLCAMLPGARVLQDGDATLAGFRREAPGCRILHLATHALYRADNPLFSGLRFSDGWLLARDLYDIRLGCDLATLSACQTGVAQVAPGDELFGLMRGFLAAGARSVAASFWPADDEATAELMRHFYQGVTGGRTRAASLRAAQKNIRGERPHPYHWAAFALTGER